MEKPDPITAMQNIIDDVKQQFPLCNQDTFICDVENNCTGCPKKLMEMVDSELAYWQHQLDRRISPKFDDIRRFGKMCSSVRRALVKNGRIPN